MRNILNQLMSGKKESSMEAVDSSGKKYFYYDLTIYLKDVNLFGTTYFSRYFEWQGIIREEYYLRVKDYDKLLQSGITLITKTAWLEYFKPTRVFDKIRMHLRIKNLKNFSFEIVFEYYNRKDNLLVAKGGQKIVFTDSTGKLIPIPENIRKWISNHLIE